MALLVTRGFADLLHIGNQARPNLFDLSVKRLDKLYEKVVEIDERVTMEGFAEDPEPQAIDISSDPDLVEGLSGEAVRILKKPDYDVVRKDLQTLWDEGFRSLALALMHSYAYSEHELRIAEIARTMGFKIAVSSQLQPMIKIVPRAQSATADAYLSPVIQDYLASFAKGFQGEFRDEKNLNKLLLSQSDGGLVSFQKFTGLRAILSGPAGGIIGMAKTCYDPKDRTPVLGFDMGGKRQAIVLHCCTIDHTTRNLHRCFAF